MHGLRFSNEIAKTKRTFRDMQISLDGAESIRYFMTFYCSKKSVLRIRIGFNAEPDTDHDLAFFVNPDPDPDPGFR